MAWTAVRPLGHITDGFACARCGGHQCRYDWAKMFMQIAPAYTSDTSEYTAAVLLWSRLNETQRHQLLRTARVNIYGSGGHCYTIASTGMVYGTQLTKYQYLADLRDMPARFRYISSHYQNYCCAPAGGVALPAADLILIHKLWLEADELGWLSIAH